MQRRPSARNGRTCRSGRVAASPKNCCKLPKPNWPAKELLADHPGHDRAAAACHALLREARLRGLAEGPRTFFGMPLHEYVKVSRLSKDSRNRGAYPFRTLQFLSGVLAWTIRPSPTSFTKPPISWRSTATTRFRIRSYRRAAEALEGLPQQVSGLIDEPKKLLEIPGIGKGMAANIQELCRSGKAWSAPGVTGEIPALDAGAAEDPGTRSRKPSRCCGAPSR